MHQRERGGRILALERREDGSLHRERILGLERKGGIIALERREDGSLHYREERSDPCIIERKGRIIA